VVRDSADATADYAYYEDVDSCAKALEDTVGNILLTTGSKELKTFCGNESLRERIYARVLPAEESLRLCREAGVDDRHIIAMFGPFSKEMNEAMIQQYEIKTLVTKESGRTGGFLEKLMAADACDCSVKVIGRPKEESGYTVNELLRELIPGQARLEIQLVGIGMGDAESLTLAGKVAIEKADVLWGARRMISAYENVKSTEEIYLAKDILPRLQELVEEKANKKITVLFSGDSGIYSGAAKLYAQITEWKDSLSEEDAAGITLRMLPGISSVSYFAAKLAEAYSDAVIESWHGKASDEFYPGHLAARIRRNEKTFVYLSGASDVSRLGELLLKSGLQDCSVAVAYQLSYQEEQIFNYDSVEALLNHSGDYETEGLYIAFVKNANPNLSISVELSDEAFERARVPMTKADIRHLSVTKLHLTENAVLYDVGAGTGSISIEAAKQHDSIRVFAFEKKKEAADLIRENAARFGCPGIQVIEGFAPECFGDAPAPTHAFIGGSSGNLEEIIDELMKRNPKVRIVMNAISVETIGQFADLLKKYPDHSELIQVTIAKNKQAGNYTLMESQNPVYIACLN